MLFLTILMIMGTSAEQQIKEIGKLFTELSQLDESELLQNLHQKIENAIPQVQKLRTEIDKEIADQKVATNKLEEAQQNLNELLFRINAKTEDKIQVWNSFDHILSLHKKKEDNLQKQKEAAIELLRYLEVLYNNGNSIEELQNTCFLLFEQLPQKINDVIKNPKTQSAASDAVTAIVYLLAGIFLEIGIAIPVTIATAIINNIVKSKIEQVEHPSIARSKRPRLNFYEMGLCNGDILNWKDDPSITIVVCSGRTVLFNNKELFLSEVTRDLKKCKSHVSPCPHWLYKGKRLSDIYDETYPIC